MEDDYESAIKCLQGNLPDWIIIQNRQTDNMYGGVWTKLRDRDTLTYAEQFVSDNCFNYRGICLDIYRVFKVPKKDVEKTIIKENIDYYNRKKLIPGAMTEEQFNQKMSVLLPKYKEAELVAETNDDNTPVYAFVSTYKHNYYELDWLFPLKKYKFEDTEFFGPNNADIILSSIYKDYKVVPPFEKRKTHYKWVKKI